MNSSSVRSRGTLLANLKEATLSHHVSTQPRATQPLGSITSSLIQPLRVKSPADSTLERRGRKKKAQEGGLLSFFKPQSEREGRAPPRTKEGTVHRTTSKSVHERQNNSGQVSLETSTVVLLEEVSVFPPPLSLLPLSSLSPLFLLPLSPLCLLPLSSLSPPSLLRLSSFSPYSFLSLSSLSPPSLISQVDVLFDSDRGFWSGVYDVIETSRRPIILTCNGTVSHCSIGPAVGRCVPCVRFQVRLGLWTCQDRV